MKLPTTRSPDFAGHPLWSAQKLASSSHLRKRISDSPEITAIRLHGAGRRGADQSSAPRYNYFAGTGVAGAGVAGASAGAGVAGVDGVIAGGLAFVDEVVV